MFIIAIAPHLSRFRVARPVRAPRSSLAGVPSSLADAPARRPSSFASRRRRSPLFSASRASRSRMHVPVRVAFVLVRGLASRHMHVFVDASRCRDRCDSIASLDRGGDSVDSV
jgi:hypothetical protein